MKAIALTLALGIALIAAGGCGAGDDAASGSGGSEKPTLATGEGPYTGEPQIWIPAGPPPTKLEIRDRRKGHGAEAKDGDEVAVKFVAAGYDTKEKFETSWDNGRLFWFPIGGDRSVRVLAIGVKGMRVGGRRELIAPANLVYGEEAAIYVVDLLKIEYGTEPTGSSGS